MRSNDRPYHSPHFRIVDENHLENLVPTHGETGLNGISIIKERTEPEAGDLVGVWDLLYERERNILT